MCSFYKQARNPSTGLFDNNRISVTSHLASNGIKEESQSMRIPLRKIKK